MDRPGDWQCPNTDCFNHTKMVFGSKSHCPKCGSARDGSAALPVMGMQAQGVFQGGRPAGQGDWQCPNPDCFNHTRMVFGSKSHCPKCGSARDGSAAMPVMGMQAQGVFLGGRPAGQGDWSCPNTDCFNHTKMVFGSKAYCPKCGSARPEGLAEQPGMSMQAQGGFQGGCHAGQGDWQCPNTDCFNHTKLVFGSKSNCPKCGSARPDGFAEQPGMAMQAQVGFQSMPGGGGFSSFNKPGDWQCPNPECFNHTKLVFGSKANCPRCGSARDAAQVDDGMSNAMQGMQQGGDVPGGWQQPGDWQCPNTQCFNHVKMVFGSKAHCPRCGSARDGSEMQVQMGMGMQVLTPGSVQPDDSAQQAADFLRMQGMLGQPGLSEMPGQQGGLSEMPAQFLVQQGGGAKPADWQCPNTQCFNHVKMVFGSKSHCPRCGSAPDGSGMGMGMQAMTQGGFGAVMGGQGGGNPGDWRCPNAMCPNSSKMVFAKHANCPQCGSEKPANAQTLGSMGMMGNGMAMGGGMAGMGGGMAHSNPGNWQCPNASCVNHSNMVFARHASCPKCGVEKPANAVTAGMGAVGGNMMGGMMGGMGGMGGMAGMGGMSGNPGDWRCPNPSCVNSTKMVFAKHMGCPQCGAEKPANAETAGMGAMGGAMGMMGGMMGRMGGRGGSNPGDWKCPNQDCKNHRSMVFAKHSSCPSCGMEKPAEGMGDMFGTGMEDTARSRSPHRMMATTSTWA